MRRFLCLQSLAPQRSTLKEPLKNASEPDIIEQEGREDWEELRNRLFFPSFPIFLFKSFGSGF